MNLDISPEEFGLNPCPAAGEGCHGWIYKAAHRLLAAGYSDEDTEAWIDAYLGRPAQPREISNTISKVRAELEGRVPQRKPVGARRPKNEEAIAEMLKDGPTSVEDFMASSPVDVASSKVDASEVLKALFPGEKTILFVDHLSQGQLVWSAETPAEDVRRLGKTNSEGAWFLLNPVTGEWAEREGAKPTRRSEINTTAYRHVLIEADNVALGDWLTILRKVALPIVSVTLSGNASAHAIVRVEAANRDEWLAAANKLADIVVPLGADPNAITAVRLTCLPGVIRKDTAQEQKLIYFNPDAEKLAVSNAGDSSEVSQKKISEKSSEIAEGQIDDIFYDGKAYFMRSNDGVWRYEMTSVLTSVLKTRGYSDRAPKGATASDLDKAKARIREERRVDGAGPKLFSKNEVWREGGRKFLNTASAEVLPAAPTAGKWGEFFPRYAEVLDNTFVRSSYKTCFLSWFKRFYESAEAGELELGQALVLVGPVQCFKTFVIEKILAPAMGGYADLSSIVAGESNGFNSELFHSPLAVIDDSKAAESESAINRYASAIKKLVAHGRHKYHEKFVTPILVEWKGRVVIAANDDAVSIKSVPTLDISNEDKLIVLAMKTWEDNPGPNTYKDVVPTELPHLLAWLKEFRIPEMFDRPNDRYGIQSMVATEIRDKIEAASRSAELRDTIIAWWRRRDVDVQKTPWEGTTVDLHQAFNDSFDNGSLSREWSVRALGHRLAQLSNLADSGVTIIQRRYGKEKVTKWRIDPPVLEESEPEPAPKVEEPY